MGKHVCATSKSTCFPPAAIKLSVGSVCVVLWSCGLCGTCSVLSSQCCFLCSSRRQNTAGSVCATVRYVTAVMSPTYKQ